MKKRKRFDHFLALIDREGLPVPETEVAFVPGRRFRADYLWPEHRVIVERDGGIMQFPGQRYGRAAAGAHSRVEGILRDMEKANLAQIAGYVFLRFTGRDLDTGAALTTIRAALDGRHVVARRSS